MRNYAQQLTVRSSGKLTFFCCWFLINLLLRSQGVSSPALPHQNVTDFVASPSTPPSAPFTSNENPKENLGALSVPEDEKLFTKSDLQQLITDLRLNDKHFIAPSEVVIKEQINEGSSSFIFKYDFSIEF